MQLAVGQGDPWVEARRPVQKDFTGSFLVAMNKMLQKLPSNCSVSNICWCVSGSVSVWVQNIKWVICGVITPPPQVSRNASGFFIYSTISSTRDSPPLLSVMFTSAGCLKFWSAWRIFRLISRRSLVFVQICRPHAHTRWPLITESAEPRNFGRAKRVITSALLLPAGRREWTTLCETNATHRAELLSQQPVIEPSFYRPSYFRYQ